MVIRDKKTGQEFEGPDGTPFDASRYEVVVSTAEERPPGPGENRDMGDLRRQVERTYSPEAEPFDATKMGSNLLRYGAPAAAATLGPGGLLGSLAVSALAGAGGSAGADALEGKEFSPGRTALAGATGGGSAAVSRPLGALAGVAKAKMGSTRLDGELDLSGLQGMANQAMNVKGLLGTRVPGAAETIKDVLGASGGKVPINAPGLQPSAELIRKGIPYRQPGGKEMYGSFRDAAKGQSPEYDKLLQQFHSYNALTDKISLKEVIAGGMFGGQGGMQMGWPGILAVLLPRLLNSARYAPSAPGIQTGLSTGLTGLANPQTP